MPCINDPNNLNNSLNNNTTYVIDINDHNMNVIKKPTKWSKAKRFFKKWGINSAKWFIGVPAEITCAYAHVAICFGCLGRIGNPVTPILEEVPYDVLYSDKMDKGMSFFTSGIMAILRGLCCIFTLAGCCGLACSPKDGISMVKYDEDDV